MKITVWGCRGSLPTPGSPTTHFGGNTTCIEVRLEDNTVIVFDAGSGIRLLGKKLAAELNIKEIHLVLTHAHWDHLMGFPFFAPAYMKRFTIYVRGGPTAKQSLRGYLKQQMKTPFFPVPFDAMKADFNFTQGEPKVRSIGSAELIPIRMSHPNNCYGFKLVEGDKQFVFFTDHELRVRHKKSLLRDEYVELCQDAELLFHDAQYTEQEYSHTKGWGHSTIMDTVNFGIEARVKSLGLFHHDPDRTDHQIADMEMTVREDVRARSAEMECYAVRESMIVDL